MAAKPLALSIINKGTIYYDLNKSWWIHIKIQYNSMDKRWIYSIKMLSMVPLNVVDASDEDQSLSFSNSGGSAARPRCPPPCGDLRQLSDEWMSMGNHLGAPRGLYLWPWCAIGRSLHEISHVQSSNNANRCPGCVPRNYLQLWYSLLSLETKIRSQKQPLSDFGLVCTAGISRISPSSLTQIGPSICPNRSYHWVP
jgi:hypothetical protein